jgi:hypothetical protein
MFNEKESCELILIHKTDNVDNSLNVKVDAIVKKDSGKCLITMTDISEIKKVESELKKTIQLLQDQNR